MEIKIRGLEVEAIHGALNSEKMKPQKFVFDGDFDIGFCASAFSDELKDTVNYAELCALIESVATKNSFNLLEKLVCECAFSILESFKQICKIELTCYKPNAPMPQKFSSVGISVRLERVTAYLSLGSSMGERERLLERGINLLDKTRGITVDKVSQILETAPYGGVAKNKFLNCAARIITFLPPHTLLDEIHRIENECGRVRDKHWDDRTLDIDIIFYGDKRICDDALVIPHPDYVNRDFVVKPLKSIAPHLFNKE